METRLMTGSNRNTSLTSLLTMSSRSGILTSALTRGILSTSSGNGLCLTLYLIPTSLLGIGRPSGTKTCCGRREIEIWVLSKLSSKFYQSAAGLLQQILLTSDFCCCNNVNFPIVEQIKGYLILMLVQDKWIFVGWVLSSGKEMCPNGQAKST